ncbi:MAG: hypothetical protein A2583_04860 [Bdellovibrionales bacterium RIFOXYD1_FULL_53_11]|nr:MAG: hypothetical protein A2583_04860 [Bdellovibrionales bacterium RIFOXYD1_FULL_53_11]
MTGDTNLRILIVDDMPAMRGILSQMARDAGFSRIVEAEDGESAWMQVKCCACEPADAFGLVVSDWNMPGMNGIELLRTVRAYTPTRDLPFFMVTGEGDHAHLSDAVEAGVTDYIVKPFTGTQLRDKIAKALP